MNNYCVYRTSEKTLVSRLTIALEHFHVHNGKMPRGICVNPKDFDAARSIVKALDIQDLEVTTSGGCLVGEIWLQTSNGGGTN